jgi:hypothetical protein
MENKFDEVSFRDCLSISLLVFHDHLGSTISASHIEITSNRADKIAIDENGQFGGILRFIS